MPWKEVERGLWHHDDLDCVVKKVRVAAEGSWEGWLVSSGNKKKCVYRSLDAALSKEANPGLPHDVSFDAVVVLDERAWDGWLVLIAEEPKGIFRDLDLAKAAATEMALADAD